VWVTRPMPSAGSCETAPDSQAYRGMVADQSGTRHPPPVLVGRTWTSYPLRDVGSGPREAPLGRPALRGFRSLSGRSPMATSKAEEYRTKAREAEQLAEQARNFAIREQLLNIAQQWKAMAAFEEKFGRP
jgi:hypothetical protein